MLTDSEKRDLARALKDATAKVAALPERIKIEDEQAEAEKREPVAVQPLTEISAALVVKAIADIKTVPDELSIACRDLKRSCGKLVSYFYDDDGLIAGIIDRKVNVLSEQLKAVLEAGKPEEQLEAAGAKGETDAPSQG